MNKTFIECGSEGELISPGAGNCISKEWPSDPGLGHRVNAFKFFRGDSGVNLTCPIPSNNKNCDKSK